MHPKGYGFYVLDDLFFVVFDIEGHRVDFSAVEAFGEQVYGSCFGVGVSHLELFVCEFAIDEKHAFVYGYLVCHLYCVDGFAEVTVREEAADFSFVPEFEIQGSGVGSEGCIG